MSATEGGENEIDVDINEANMTDQSDTADLSAMEDSDIPLEHLPQTSSHTEAIETINIDKGTTTDESSNKIYKMVTIDDKIMLVEESQYKLNVYSDNETMNDCPIVEEYLEEDIFDEEPVTDDEPVASTVKSDLEVSIEKTYISKTVADKLAIQKQLRKNTKVESDSTRHNPSEIKVFAYNSCNKNVEKPNISLQIPKPNVHEKETNQSTLNTLKKGKLVDKEIFKKFYASNTPFKEKFNNIQRDLDYEKLFPAVYIGHDRNDNDSNTGKSNNEGIQDYNDTTYEFGVTSGNRGSSDEHKIQSCKMKLNNIVQDFVDHFANIMNYQWYNNQDVLIYGRNGTAMVLLHEAKYIAMKEIITGQKIPNLLAPKDKAPDPSLNKLMNERNMFEGHLKRCQDELKILRNENDIYEKEYCALKQKIRRLEEELKDFRMFKEDLGKIYTPAQIRMMTPHRRNNVNWTDDDFKKAIILYQMVGAKVYKYIKMQLRFPLPSLGALNRWNKDKKISNPKSTRIRTAIKRKETRHDDVSQETSDNLNMVIKCEVQHEELSTSNLDTSDAAEINDTMESQQAADMITADTDSLVQNDDMNEENPDGQYYLLGDESTIDSSRVTIAKTERDDCLHIDNDNKLQPRNDANNDNNKPPVSKYSKWELDGVDNYEKGKTCIKDKHSWKLNCKLCMKPHDNEQQLKEHVQEHYFNTYYTSYLDAESPFVCEFCNEQVRKRDMLVRHHILHLGITEFKCWHPGCKYVSKSKVCLTDHISRHLPRRHSCPKCSAAFTKRKQLREHFARRHSARQRHICHLCSAKCLSDYTFHLHLESHKKPPTFKCPRANCSESFYCRRDLLDHGAQHGDNPRQQYKCELCPLATFSQAMHLKRHKEYHKNYKISHCGNCHQIFESYTDYYMHIATHHKVSCVCSRSFRCKSKLIRHQKECRLVRKNSNAKKHDEESNEEILPTTNNYIHQAITPKQDTSMDQIETTDDSIISEKTMNPTQNETIIMGKRAATIKLEQVSPFPNKKQTLVTAGQVPKTITTIPQQRVHQKLLEQNSNKQIKSKKTVMMINKNDHSEIIKQENLPWSTAIVQTSEYSQYANTWEQQQENDEVLPGTSFQPDMPHIDL